MRRIVALLIFVLPFAFTSEFSCSVGEHNVVPSQVFMSSSKSRKKDEEKCLDGVSTTFCATKQEPNPFFVFQYDKPVEVLGVHIKNKATWAGSLGNITITVASHAPIEGELMNTGRTLANYVGPALPSELLTFTPDTPAYKPRAGMEGSFVVIQKMGAKTVLSMDEVRVCAEPLGNIPGTPGGPWDPMEVDVVQQKLRYLFRRSVRTNKTHIITDEKFPPIVNEVWTAGFEYKRNRTQRRRQKHLGFSTRKMIQLAFHDCLRYKDGSGGCDGCLNWKGMDNLHKEPPGNMGTVSEGQPHYRSDPVQKSTDNNRLSTTAMVLEWVYRDPTWPPGAPTLPISLKSSGKSRADLWQFAANVAMEIELVKSNWGCQQRNNYNRQVTVLEGLDKCLVKLHKPIPFQHGRKDCVRNTDLMTTDFDFEATKEESHPNPHGSGDSVLTMMKEEFGISGSQSIALMAVHGMAPEDHNTNLKNQYRWPGNPFISNMYHKALANRPMYLTGNWLNAGPPWDSAYTSTLVGDQQGKPVRGDIQGGATMECKMFWNTTNPDSGPCFFRTLRINTKGMNQGNPEWLPRTNCFKWNFDTETYEKQTSLACTTAEIDPETGVQKGGEPPYWYNINGRCRYSMAFFLVYEVSFVQNFTVDEENHPRGCNIPNALKQDGKGWSRMEGYEPVSCGPNNFKLPGESMSSSEITTALADDHDLWEREFLDGWAQLQKNGYGDSLVDGPENSWFGYSLVPEGTPIEFPLLFGQDMDPDSNINEDYIIYRSKRHPGIPPDTHAVID